MKNILAATGVAATMFGAQAAHAGTIEVTSVFARNGSTVATVIFTYDDAVSGLPDYADLMSFNPDLITGSYDLDFVTDSSINFS